MPGSRGLGATRLPARGPGWPALRASAVAASLLVACGGDGEVTPRATTAPPVPTTTPAATTAAPYVGMRGLAEVVRNAALAEEMHYSDTGTYTRKLADLLAQQLEVPPGVTVAVVSANATGYCLSARGKAGVVYLDSDAGKVSEKPCT